MQCPKCKEEISDNSKFCSNCGKPIPRVDTYAASGKESERYIADTYKEEAAAAYKAAVKKIDQAVAKGILHKNNAAHKKSEFTLALNKLA